MRSVSVRGDRYSDRLNSGAGSAARSTFPVGVTGIAGSTVNATGTMYDGSTAARERRISAGSAGACAGTM